MSLDNHSSFGPVADIKKWRSGCKACFIENYHRERGIAFGKHPESCPKCGRRLSRFRKQVPQFKIWLLDLEQKR